MLWWLWTCPSHMKNITALPRELQNSFAWCKVHCFPPKVGGSEKASCVVWHWWLWKEPVVMCGNLNVRQATSQQVFKVSTIFMEAHFQSFLPCWNSAHISTSRYCNSCVSPIGTLYTSCPRCSNQPGLGDNRWLATYHDWWNGQHRHDCHVLVHCLGLRQTRPQQCCLSLAAALASATRLNVTVQVTVSKQLWLNCTVTGAVRHILI